MSRSTVLFALISVLLIHAPSPASAHEARTFLRQEAGGTTTVQELVVTTESPESPSVEVVRFRDSGVIWQRTYTDAIYLTSELSGPAGVIAAGTYLNPPEQIEVVPTVGDGTPDWTFPGTEFYTAASRDASVIAGVDYDPTTLTVTVYRWAPDSDVPLWSTEITPASRGAYRTVAVSADGSTIAVLVSMQIGGPEARLYLFDPDSNVPIGIYDGPAGFGRNFSISDDGRFTAFIGLATAYVVDRDAGAIRWSGSMGATNDPIAISSDGDHLAFGWTSLKMYEWNGTSYSTLWTIAGAGRSLKSCAFSDDGTTFVAGWYSGDYLRNRIQLFEMPSSTPLWTYDYLQGSGAYQDIPYDIAVTADGAYVAVGSWGDQYDTNPEVHLFGHDAPEPLLTVDMPGSVFDIDLVPDGSCGLFITACGKHVHANEMGRGGDLLSIRYECPASAEELRRDPGALRLDLLPNPFREGSSLRFTLDDPARVYAAVYSPTGRRIRTLADHLLPSGTNTLIWDGRTEDGRDAPSGIYLVRVSSDGRAAIARGVLVRR